MSTSTAQQCRVNPFETQGGTSSCYLGMTSTGLRRIRHEGPVDADAQQIHDEFREMIEDRSYSCTGAKSAFRRNAYRFGVYDELGKPDFGLAHDLFEFKLEQPELPQLSTFVASFSSPEIISEQDFHELLFEQLQFLLDVDPMSWDSTVSADPEDPSFSLSVFGKGWFVVGLNPKSSRVARQFARPALVFNAHSQFEELRSTGQYQSMQRTIRSRDQRLQPDGTINPNLSDFGASEGSPEWRQASGMQLGPEERCPLHIADKMSVIDLREEREMNS